MSFDYFANLVNPRHWFNPEPGPPNSPIFLIFAVIGVVAFVVAAYVRWRRKLLFPGDGLKMRLAARASEVTLWLAGTALFLILMRYANVPFLATPILFYLTVLTAIGFVVYGIYYWTQRYPLQRAAYDAQLERARFLPEARRRRAAASARHMRERATAKRR